MADYVKFKKGKPSEFEKLVEKNLDTLYFIYEDDALTGKLYLGNKLISGTGEITGATSLKGLSDVLLSENFDSKDCLVYDISLNKWVNKPITTVIGNFIGTNSTSVGVPGLVPAVDSDQVGQTGLFLRSDGKWAEVVSASSAKIFQTILTTGETHLDAINRIIGDLNETPSSGDIVVLRDLICEENNYQHIAYVYDGNEWIALDGNYNAENVYLADDLTITADIGVQKLNGQGSKVLNTAGKNLKQVFNMLLSERVLPKRYNPTVSVLSNTVGSYEVGTTLEVDYSATLNPGSYSYGPVTNVQPTAWSATFDEETIIAQSGTFKPIVITDGFNEKIVVTATHTKGEAPFDNLKTIITDNSELINTQIQAGDKIGYSQAITAHRNSFYTSSTETITLTSDSIRDLNKIISSENTIIIDVIEGATQVIIAVPVGRKVTEVADKVAFGTDIFSEFEKTVVSVAGAAAGYEKDYNVYVYNPAVALGKNVYTVLIEDEEV